MDKSDDIGTSHFLIAEGDRAVKPIYVPPQLVPMGSLHSLLAGGAMSGIDAIDEMPGRE